MPQPPNVDTELVEGGIGERPCPEVNPSCDPQPMFELTGGPGSVTGSTIIWVVNLDGTSPPQTAPVEPDGSFTILVDGAMDVLLEGDLSEEYRLQARRDNQRSTPIDIVADFSSGDLFLADRPLEDCFTITQGLELDFGVIDEPMTLDVQLMNSCTQELVIDAVRLRTPTSSLQVGASPSTVGIDETATVQIDVTPDVSGLIEEILLIEVNSPERDRRPVTLIGEASSD